jgi:hypothetical protein
MHTIPVKSRLVGKEAMHLTSIVVVIHGCCPQVDIVGLQAVVVSLVITLWVVVQSLWYK